MEKRMYVLTGGGCSGKTTLINELNKKGYNTISETAREVLSDYSSEMIKINYLEIQKRIHERQLNKEKSTKGITFLDRSALENIAYCSWKLGHIPDFLSNLDFSERYRAVFMTERLPLVKDNIRIEKDDAEASEIHNRIYSAYRVFGYEPIIVPVMSIKERLEFILSHVEKNGKRS